jgi:hypothetical protein
VLVQQDLCRNEGGSVGGREKDEAKKGEEDKSERKKVKTHRNHHESWSHPGPNGANGSPASEAKYSPTPYCSAGKEEEEKINVSVRQVGKEIERRTIDGW